MIKLLIEIDRMRQTLCLPEKEITSSFPESPELTPEENKSVASMMRVNHVGEICAQALYSAQSLMAKTEEERQLFLKAADEEFDHLTWMKHRLTELNDRPSLLSPLWYVGAFAIGTVAGLSGKANSLGFMQETEKQVEAHLAGHLERLPPQDSRSKAMLEKMQADEIQHQHTATVHGASSLPTPIPQVMKTMAKVMTTVAARY
jgi:ubiquinone biosynthesis monooxygenase Coq7